MNKQQTTHSHTVPQMYLKNFANDKNQVWVYSLKDNKCFKQNIRNVCVKNKTYEFKKNEIDNTLENLFCKYENLWAQLFLDIIKGKNILTKKDIVTLLYFCLAQSLRTTQGRNKLITILKNNNKHNNIIKKKIFNDINIENFLLFHSIGFFENIIESYIVTEIKICKTPKEIYITDDPIIIGPLLSCIYCPLTSYSYIILKLIPKTTILHYQNPIIIKEISSKNYDFSDFNFLNFNLLNFNFLNFKFLNLNYSKIDFLISINFEYVIKKTEFTFEEIKFLRNLKCY